MGGQTLSVRNTTIAGLPREWITRPLADPPSRLYWAILVSLSLICVAPLLLVDVPPLLDYPNHLARMVILANPADPYLAQFYAPRWRIIPDLGIDLVLPSMLQVLPVHVAGRLAVAVIVLLPLFGTVALSRAITGRCTAWSLGAALVVWNHAALMGFLNYTTSLGLGLLLAAAWIAWRESHPARALVLALLGGPVLFFCHLMGVICFAMLIGPYELRASFTDPRSALRRGTLAAAPFVVPALLYWLSPLGDLAAKPRFPGVTDKAAELLAPFENYVLILDILTAFVVIGLFVAGRPRITRLALLTAGLIGLAFLASPSGFKGGGQLDTRFVVLFGFLLFALFRPTLTRAGSVLLAALFVVRMAVLAAVWAGHGADLAQLRQAVAAVPPGATVFLAGVAPDEAPEAWAEAPRSRRLSGGDRLDVHMPALLPIERRAFWPLLFDNLSQQPVATRPPYRELAEQAGGIADARALPDANLCGFDYVLLINADVVGELGSLEAGRLTLLNRTGFAALFAVDRGQCAGPRKV